MQFSHFRVQLYPKLHEKACNYLLIIYFIKCSLIFQDSYMSSGDMYDHLSWSLILATLDKVKATAFEDLPTVKLVLNRIEHKEDGSVTYQGVDLERH